VCTVETRHCVAVLISVVATDDQDDMDVSLAWHWRQERGRTHCFAGVAAALQLQRHASAPVNICWLPLCCLLSQAGLKIWPMPIISIIITLWRTDHCCSFPTLLTCFQPSSATTGTSRPSSFTAKHSPSMQGTRPSTLRAMCESSPRRTSKSRA
jgi:hypothetical protein